MDNAHNRRAEDRRAPGALQWGESAASEEPVGEPVNAAKVTLDKVCDLFGIGALARTESTILENVRNAIRREECLSAIERTFFMVPAERDEDFPDHDPGEECLLGWGRDPEQYVDQFRSALASVATPALNPSEKRAAALEEVAQFFEMQDGSPATKKEMGVAAKLARLLATKPAGWAQQSAEGADSKEGGAS